jgi:phosphoglycolate phosphatase
MKLDAAENTGFRYLLFDLDGTLTEPKEGITRSVQYALKAMGIDEPDLDKLVPFIGPPLVDSFMRFYGLTEDQAHQAVEKYRERFEPVGIFENRVIDGIPELLNVLKSQGKILAVASSKPEVYVRKILEKFDLMKYFDCVVGSELNGTHNDKSEVICEVKKRLAIEGREAEMLMIGDRCYDIDGAK